MIELIMWKWLNTSFDVIVWDPYRKASYATDLILDGATFNLNHYFKKLSCKSIILAGKKEKSALTTMKKVYISFEIIPHFYRLPLYHWFIFTIDIEAEGGTVQRLKVSVAQWRSTTGNFLACNFSMLFLNVFLNSITYIFRWKLMCCNYVHVL